jgi:hypothetical protein
VRRRYGWLMDDVGRKLAEMDPADDGAEDSFVSATASANGSTSGSGTTTCSA